MNNNFSAFRLLCASLVIVTHSYELLGMGKDALYTYSNNQVSLSHLAVNTFFVISGFLIFKSAQRSTSFKDFAIKRFLRIYPGYFCAVVISFIIAGLCYNGSDSFLLKSDSWRFLYRNLSILFLQHEIVGVFNFQPIKAINGSLWTIPYEVLCYAITSLLLIFPFLKKYGKQFLFFGFAVLFIVNTYINFVPNLMHELGVLPTITSLGMYFLAGALMNFIHPEKLDSRLLFLIGLLCVLAVPLSSWFMIFYIFWPIAIIGLGLKSFPILNNVDNKIGDISYGIYLYAFPIQQVIIYLGITNNPLVLIVYSIILACGFGKASWEFIEKPFLKLKPKQSIQIKY